MAGHRCCGLPRRGIEQLYGSSSIRARPLRRGIVMAGHRCCGLSRTGNEAVVRQLNCYGAY